MLYKRKETWLWIRLPHYYPYCLFQVCSVLANTPEWNILYKKKGWTYKESTIYVDGFLAKGTPAFAGDENEPGDRLGIPFVNGFGRKLLVKFVDRSSETGLKIEDGEVQLSFQGDKQYAYFPISGTPTQDGSVPISFDIFEDGEKLALLSLKQFQFGLRALNVLHVNSFLPVRNLLFFSVEKLTG